MENENELIKEKLIENISELYLKYGLRSTSMDDICTHLKISKKTLYQFFINKDDVVEQIMIYRREEKRKQAELNKMSEMNPVAVLFSIKKHIIDDLSSRLPANLFDIKKYHPEVYQRISDCDTVFINNLMTRLLESGIHNHYFRKEIDMEIQIYLFSKQMSFLGDPEMMSSISYPIPVIISTIVDNFILSIATPTGVEEYKRLSREAESNKNTK